MEVPENDKRLASREEKREILREKGRASRYAERRSKRAATEVEGSRALSFENDRTFDLLPMGGNQ